jgi:hypothetical protein
LAHHVFPVDGREHSPCGDGRVVITAFGERVAFREKDAANIEFFWEADCNPHYALGTSLERWLNDPKMAECLDRTIPNDVSHVVSNVGTITFQVTLTLKDGLVYPGGTSPNEISKASLFPRRLYVVLRHTSLKATAAFMIEEFRTAWNITGIR